MRFHYCGCFFLVILAACSQSTRPKGVDRVTDLSIVSRSDSTLTLTWTAPGDGAGAYDVRSAPAFTALETWDACDSVEYARPPRAAGQPETLVVAGLRRIAPRAGLDRPSWSPDGVRVAYVDGQAGWGQFLRVTCADADSTARILTDQLVMSPAWSPDGTRIACVAPVLGFVPSGGGAFTRLELPEWSSPTDPAWSPDGSRIAFCSEGETGVGSLCVSSATGGAAHCFVFGDCIQPAWSPRDSVVVYVVRDGPGQGLWKVSTQGGEQTCLVQGIVRSPSFSPDGSRIAFRAGGASDSEIRIIPATGGTAIAVPMPDNPGAKNPLTVA